MDLKSLAGSGRKIGMVTFPFLIAGLSFNFLNPAFFSVGGPASSLSFISVIVLIPGLILWFWSVVLILTQIPKGRLITKGPYALVRHPLYTSVALLVLPWAGILFNTWLGIFIGFIIYLASRLYSPDEEKSLSLKFGEEWVRYSKTVLIKWL